MKPGERTDKVATAAQAVNIGADLRQRLEQVARLEGRDATSLARLALRELVEQRERAAREVERHEHA